MDLIHWAYGALRTITSIFPIEVALTLGVLFFALSWIRPRSIVSLPAAGPRRTHLATLGLWGSVAIFVVATVTSWLPTLNPDMNAGGWWQRALPLAATAIVVAIAALVFRREPRPAPGNRAIAPRRSFWAFTPATARWLLAGSGLLLLLTTAWQIAVGERLPEGADRYGIGPEGQEDLPVFTQLQHGMGYFWGTGWPNHLAALCALLLAAVVIFIALGADANRPVSVTRASAEVREERLASARLLTYVSLGGMLLTLGAVWAFVGYVGQAQTGLEATDAGDETLPEQAVDSTEEMAQ